MRYELTRLVCWGKCLIMQYGETTCCQRMPGRANDEGNDLLLNSERGAGGVVVSKEEVAVGRKGSGGAWGSTSRNAGLAGPAPQNGRIRTPAKKTANSRTLPASSSLLEAQTAARRVFTRKRGITGLGRKSLLARVLGQPKRRLVSPRLPPPQRRGTTEAA